MEANSEVIIVLYRCSSSCDVLIIALIQMQKPMMNYLICNTGTDADFNSAGLNSVFIIDLSVFSKGLLMVVSRRWFEFCPEVKFPYPLLTPI